MSDLNIAVLGAGVVGLTTAIEIQKEIRGAKLTIIADKFTTDTTSDGAAGLFRPGTSFSGPNETTTRKWIQDSYAHWEDIWRSPEGANAGITQLSGYIFSSICKDITQNHLINKIVPLYRPAYEDELSICPGNWKYGSFFITMLTECGLYLPWAMKKIEQNNGQFVSRRINSFSEIDDSYDIVVNCTGLGAKRLCKDYLLVPIRGQIRKVHAPFIKTFFFADYDNYIVPGFKGVTLGGTRNYDSYDLSLSPYDSAAIKNKCEALVPSLKNSSLIKEWVGLRPHRTPVRVEKEIISVNGHQLKVVHNYGHGGYGVTTAPGTAKNAVKLIQELWAGKSKL